MLGFVTAVVALAGASAVVESEVTVATWDGPVEGVANDRGLSWRGIPYASPPVGDRRWQPPIRPTAWTTPIQANAFGAACPQQCILPPLACQAAVSEDCLFLNVFRPHLASTPNTEEGSGLLPTLAWIHGGRFEQGSEGVEVYDGQVIANQTGTCVVTINYRIGALAFMVYGDSIKGNFGVLDQRLALQWIQGNAKAFGCDPAQVTIFGQSAGAASVLFHMTSPASFGLYSGAIAQSTPLALPVLSHETAIQHYSHFVEETGCPSKGAEDCLRKISWQAAVAAEIKAQQKVYLNDFLSAFMPYGPTVDGIELTAAPIDLVNQGKVNKVPLIIGHVADEARMFVYEAFTKPLSKLEVEVIVRGIFNGKGVPDEIHKLYPLPEPAPADYRDYLSGIASDFVIGCPSRNVSNAMATFGKPVYRYMFNQSWSVKGLWGPRYPFCEGRPCHGVELPYVFSSASLMNITFQPAEIELSARTSNYWGAFARSAQPAVDGQPEWPLHNAATEMQMDLRAPLPVVVSRPRAAFCDLWDRLGYHFN